MHNQHRIWVTAVVHKEAYFLLPSTSSVYDRISTRPFFRGSPACLDAIQTTAARRLDPGSSDCDPDFQCHFENAAKRLSRFSITHRLLDISSPEQLSISWLAAKEKCTGGVLDELIFGLFAVAKAKPLWKEIQPDPMGDWTRSAEDFRSQIAQEIARQIATLPAQEHPIAAFFGYLKHHR